MLKQIVILSGHVCSGKSTLAAQLAQKFGFRQIKTWGFIQKRGEALKLDRPSLQQLGEDLDTKTEGAWVRDDLEKEISDSDELIVVDSIRHAGQADFLRKTYGRRVIHVHLTADLKILATRYTARSEAGTQIAELANYSKVLENRTEAQVETLALIADVVINSDQCSEEDFAIRVASHLGWYGREYLRLVDVMVGGQYGSEGKGQVAAYLGSEYDLLMRVGGPNAGHKVKVPGSDDVFTFRHLPSGSLASDVPLLIGAGAVIHIPTLLHELTQSGIDQKRLMIDRQAMTISEEDQQVERDTGGLVSRIGSTGQGVGIATARRITGRGAPGVRLARDSSELQNFLVDACEVLERVFREKKRVFLEGTQGTGLSIFHGHYPHTTSRDTTVAGCLAEAGISANRVRKVIMVCRSYPIRVMSPGEHATSGYMSKEITWAEVERRAGFEPGSIEKHELGSVSGKLRRVGEFDWKLLRKAASLNAPTDIALTFSDYLDRVNLDARRFELLSTPTIRFIEEVERVASAPVTLISTRFHERSIIDRRAW